MAMLRVLLFFSMTFYLIAALPQSPLNAPNNAGPGNTGNVKKTITLTDDVTLIKVEVNNKQPHRCKSRTWKKVDPSMVSQSHLYGVRVYLNTDNTGGLAIDGTVTRHACAGSGPGAAMIVHIKGDWSHIMYTQVFKGAASCWGVFGNDYTPDFTLKINSGLEVFNPSFGDVIFGQKRMRSTTDDIFDGRSLRCDNEKTNFWHVSNGSGERQATVILRRKKDAKDAGIQTGVACGTPSFQIKDIYVLL